jgi:acyl-CoA reductase-like NAD-dependent aldehyde dehydrogenase
VNNLRVAAAESQRLCGESIPVPGHSRLAITLREPVGVVAGITPFNRPLNQVVVKVAPAVAAGASIVVKPSERTPRGSPDRCGRCVLNGRAVRPIPLRTSDR